jgi:hypothetical protein
MSFEPDPLLIEVSEVILPSRVSTGFSDLDNLLLGGLPQSSAVVLTSPSCDERDLLIQNFLEAGVRKGEVTLLITIDATGIRSFVRESQEGFRVFICNPKADQMIESLPNVTKLKGVENLTDISIALASFFRGLDVASVAKRTCITIIPDLLLQHGTVPTRRWLAALMPEFKSRGFTTLAVMNPQMHPSEQTQAVLDLFDGELNICERETKKGSERFLRVKRLSAQEYLETEMPLRKERIVAPP